MRLKYPKAWRRKRMEVLEGGSGHHYRIIGTGLSASDAWCAAEDRMIADEFDKVLTQ